MHCINDCCGHRAIQMIERNYCGSCHCGAIGYVYSTALLPEDWSVRACQCAFCRAHDAFSTSDPQGHIAFSAADSSLLQRYRFALRTADFLLCRSCGVYIGAVIDVDSGRYGIINIHTLTPVPERTAAVVPISYDGEDTDGRVARREARWTPVREVPW
jgi:hypothetical protein